MDVIASILNFIANNWQIILAGVVGIITAALGVALAIPGEQPDKFLQGALDFLMKFSRKPKDE